MLERVGEQGLEVALGFLGFRKEEIRVDRESQVQTQRFRGMHATESSAHDGGLAEAGCT